MAAAPVMLVSSTILHIMLAVIRGSPHTVILEAIRRHMEHTRAVVPMSKVLLPSRQSCTGGTLTQPTPATYAPESGIIMEARPTILAPLGPTRCLLIMVRTMQAM